LKEKIVLRRVTQYGRRLPDEVEAIKRDFITNFWNMCNHYPYTEDTIINIDQTGVFFENPRKITLAHQGAKQAPILSGKLAVRATAVLAITMAGQKLKPYVIFKGISGPRSRITNTLRNLQNEIECSVQKNAWVDTTEMIKYIDMVLAPFMQNHLGSRCLLILDNFSVHLSSLVREKLSSLNIDPLYVPSGMTGFLQPLDISVNKPFKDELKSLYTQWLMSRVEPGIEDPRRPKPRRENIVDWIWRAWIKIHQHVIIGSFSIFHNIEAERTEGSVLTIQDLVRAANELSNEGSE
jgi:hypothetical protein